MGEEVKIDKQLFQERLAQLHTAWKADKRSGDALFNGVGSIAVVLGKAEDASYQKSNALHVGPRFHSRRCLALTQIAVLAIGIRVPLYIDGVHN